MKPSTRHLLFSFRHLNRLMNDRWACAQYLKGVRKHRRSNIVRQLVLEASGHWLGT